MELATQQPTPVADVAASNPPPVPALGLANLQVALYTPLIDRTQLLQQLRGQNIAQAAAARGRVARASPYREAARSIGSKRHR